MDKVTGQSLWEKLTHRRWEAGMNLGFDLGKMRGRRDMLELLKANQDIAAFNKPEMLLGYEYAIGLLEKELPAGKFTADKDEPWR